ncbi:hypothetical protein ACI79J_18070 [Geodermatophilus sp. SYSU D01062]
MAVLTARDGRGARRWTAGHAVASGEEPPSALRVLLLLGIVGCVIGLELTH